MMASPQKTIIRLNTEEGFHTPIRRPKSTMKPAFGNARQSAVNLKVQQTPVIAQERINFRPQTVLKNARRTNNFDKKSSDTYDGLRRGFGSRDR